MSRFIARLVGGALVAGTVTTMSLGGVVAPAAAAAAVAPIDVLLSTDGVHFSSSIAGGLFDDAGMLIPGESLTSSLWIKNPTAASAALRVTLRDMIIPPADHAGEVTMSVWNSVTRTTHSVALDEMTRCDIVIPPQSIAAGESMRMELTFTMTDVAEEVAQGESTSLSLMVAMRDSAAGAFPTSACDDDGVLIASDSRRPSTTASTGPERFVPLFILGGLLFGVGTFLITRLRRCKQD